MAYHVIPFRLEEHRDALLQLWKRNFEGAWMDTCADRRLEWLYQENPFGPAQTWLAVDTESHNVIGCGSVFPSHKYIRGRVVRVGTPIDFTVESRYRTAGAALAIQRALTGESRRAGFDCLIGKPNRKALPILSRVGYRSIGDCRNWVKALNTDLEPPEGRDASCSDELVSAADERFDELWNASKSQCQIAGEKTAAYLNWRYLAFKEMNYGVYCLTHRDDQRLVGYIVFARMEKGAFIAELFCEDVFGPVIDDLLLGFASCMRMEGQEWVALSYLGAPAFEDRLKQVGFSPRTRARALVAYVDADCDADLRHEVFDSDSSLVFGGEMDLF
jgi:hypothetical protein